MFESTTNPPTQPHLASSQQTTIRKTHYIHQHIQQGWTGIYTGYIHAEWNSNSHPFSTITRHAPHPFSTLIRTKMDENTLPRDSSSPEDPSVHNNNNDNHSETQERTSEKRPHSPEPDSILSPPNEAITEQVQAPTEAQAGQSEETQPQYHSNQDNGPTEAGPSSPANEADSHSQANEATAPAADSPSAKRRRISVCQSGSRRNSKTKARATTRTGI